MTKHRITAPVDYIQRVNFDLTERGDTLRIYKQIESQHPVILDLDEMLQRAVYERLHTKFGHNK